jgi:hypothetical protein
MGLGSDGIKQKQGVRVIILRVQVYSHLEELDDSKPIAVRA